MNNLIRVFSVGVLILGLSVSHYGCSSNNNTGTSFQSQVAPIPFVDLSLADNSRDIVLIYLQILANLDTNPGAGVGTSSPPSPDISLDNATSLVNNVNTLLMVANGSDDLYVANTNDRISIFRDYPGLSDNAAPDATLEFGNNQVENPISLDIGSDDLLVVGNGNADEVIGFANASSITGVDPAGAQTFFLDGGEAVDNPVQVHLDLSGKMFVFNGDVPANGDPVVLAWNDVTAIATNDLPDILLNEDTSFLDLGSTACQNLYTDTDTLSNGTTQDRLFASATTGSGSCAVFIFDNSSLSSDDLPEAVLFGTNLDVPFVHPSAVNDTLFVGNANTALDVCDSSPGIVGFRPVTDLTTGIPAFLDSQQPEIIISPTATGIANVPFNLTSQGGLAEAGGALFGATSDGGCVWFPVDVAIFRNTVLNEPFTSDAVPAIVLPASGVDGLGDFTSADALAVVENPV